MVNAETPVGRAGAVARLVAAEPGLVLLGGLPGLGVTTVLDDLAADLAAERASILRGRATPLDRGRPLATLAPWLNPGAPAGGHGIATTAAAVAEAWSGARAVLVDDVHLADDDTLLVFRAVAERRLYDGLLVLAYHRGPGDERVQRTFAAADEVELAPLTGADPRAGGNPWLLARLDDPDLGDQVAAMLPADEADVLWWAAALDGVGTTQRLAAASGRTPEAVAAAVTALRRRGLVDHGRSGLALRHPGLTDALAHRLEPDQRPRLVELLERSGLPPRLLAARAPYTAVRLLDPARNRAEYAAALVHSGRAAEALVHARLPSEPLPPPLALVAAQAHLALGASHDARAAAGAALAADPPEPWAARLTGVTAIAAALDGDFEAGQEALAALADTDDPQAVTYRCQVLASVSYLVRDWDAALAQLAAAAALVDEAADPAAELAGIVLKASCLDPAEALTVLESARPLAEQVGAAGLAWWQLVLALMLYNVGHWDDVLTEVERAAPHAEGMGLGQPLHALAALVAVHRGDRTRSRASVERARELAGSTRGIGLFYGGFSVVAEAMSAELEGRYDDALVLVRGIVDGVVGVHQGSTVAGVGPRLVRIALAAGDRAVAEEITAAIEAAEGVDGAGAEMSRALLSGDPDQLLAVQRRLLDLGAELEAAWVGEEAAKGLARAGRLPDARATFEPTVEAYRGLTARGELDRARASLRDEGLRLGVRGARTRPGHGWDSLTETEARVAEQVAAGRTNPEIAAQLRISPRTVQSHVSSILGKLRLSSRVEIAAEHARRG